MPCELSVKLILPAIRASVAKRLANEADLKQTEIAELLGITQPAVSNYLKKHRGSTLDFEQDKELRDLVITISDSLQKRNRANQEIRLKVCMLCKIIRRKGMLCEIHRNVEPELIEECSICRQLPC